MWHKEVKQSPQLANVILQRCSGKNELVRRTEMFSKCDEQLAVPILKAMTFVDDHILPFNSSQVGKIYLLAANELITYDENMELSFPQFRFIELNTLFGIALIPERK
jgi:hypothetical protein